ncbi:LOW QUALITY PROTEIN: hypothetical protein V2J09_006914 [Rumex salicifolius]
MLTTVDLNMSSPFTMAAISSVGPLANKRWWLDLAQRPNTGQLLLPQQNWFGSESCSQKWVRRSLDHQLFSVTILAQPSFLSIGYCIKGPNILNSTITMCENLFKLLFDMFGLMTKWLTYLPRLWAPPVSNLYDSVFVSGPALEIAGSCYL